MRCIETLTPEGTCSRTLISTACHEAHILCFLLFTHPEYHGRGAGRTMTRRGNDAADALMLPIWIEATLRGENLYRRMGFEEVEKVDLKIEGFQNRYMLMKRPVQVWQMTLDGKERLRKW